MKTTKQNQRNKVKERNKKINKKNQETFNESFNILRIVSAKLTRTLIAVLWLICLLIMIFSNVNVETSLISLIQDKNHNQVALEKVFEKSANSIQVVFEHKRRSKAISAAETFFKSINQEDFKNIRFKIDSKVQKEVLNTYIKHGSGLLSYNDQQLLDQQKLSEITDKAYNKVCYDISPAIVPFESDPFCLLSNYLQEIISSRDQWKISNGYICSKKDQNHYVLMSLDLKQFSLDTVNNLRDRAKKIEKDQSVKIYLSGVPIHSAIEMQKSIWQINIFSVVSIIVSLILLFKLLRNLRYVLPIVLNMGIAFVVGYDCLLLFPTVHMITFIFATSLIGLSIDYSFHFFSTEEKQREKLISSMLQAYITTCLCFIPLFFSELSLLKQIAVFTIVGLTTVFINTVVFYPSFVQMIKVSPNNDRFSLPKINLHRNIAIVGILLIGLGLSKAEFYTHVTSLYTPDNSTFEADKLFFELSGKTSSKFLLISGSTMEEVLQKEEEVKQNNGNFFGVSTIVPSIKKQKENQLKIKELYRDQANKLKSKLGIDLLFDFKEEPLLTFSDVEQLIEPFLIKKEKSVILLVPIQNEIKKIPAGVTVFEPRNYLEEKLNQYESSIYKSLFVSCLLMLSLLYCFYRKKLIIYIIPSILSVLCVLCILSFSNISIHLFHLLGCFIVIGVGIDYTIFNLSGFANKAVMFSFLSTLVGLGALGFSSFPVLSSMGFVFGLGLSLSFLFSLINFYKD